MFGGAEPSKAEIKAMEIEASNTIRYTLTAAAVLYISPFVVDYVQKLF